MAQEEREKRLKTCFLGPNTNKWVRFKGDTKVFMNAG
jgi:hypothetical protein